MSYATNILSTHLADYTSQGATEADGQITIASGGHIYIDITAAQLPQLTDTMLFSFELATFTDNYTPKVNIFIDVVTAQGQCFNFTIFPNRDSNGIMSVELPMTTALFSYFRFRIEAIETCTFNSWELCPAIISQLSGDITAIQESINGIIENYITSATFNNIITQYLKASDIIADNITVGELVAKLARFQTVTAMTVNAQNVLSFSVSSNYLAIADAFIKSAMIDSLSANKVNTGSLNTNLVQIQSEDGHFVIKGNTLQITDASNVTRVQIGKDAAGDYDMYLWDAAGVLMFDAQGMKAAAIKTSIIVNDMIAANANIAGSKIDIESLITSINGNVKTIDANKISYNGETLDVSLNRMITTVSDHGTLLTSQQTAIGVAQGSIDEKVWQSDIDDATGKIDIKFASVKITTDNIVSTVSSAKTAADNAQGSIDNLQIGGRNLLLGTGFPWNVGVYPDTTTLFQIVMPSYVLNTLDIFGTYLGIRVLPGTSSYTSYFLAPSLDNNKPCKVAGTYTFSFYVKADSDTRIWLCNRVINNVENAYESTPVTTSWQKVYRTFTTTGTLLNHHVWIYFDSNVPVEVSHMQVEVGSKATDWTPAPEDTITYVDDIQVGGTNLLNDSNNFTMFNRGTSVPTLSSFNNANPFGINNATLLTLTDNVTDWDFYRPCNGLIQGNQYTISVWVKLGTATNFVLTPNAQTAWFTINKQVQVTTQGWQRLSVTITATSSRGINIHLGANPEAIKQIAGTVYLYGLKFEAGNKVTDWSPAPEDAIAYTDATGATVLGNAKTYTDTTAIADRNLIYYGMFEDGHWASNGGSTDANYKRTKDSINFQAHTDYPINVGDIKDYSISAICYENGIFYASTTQTFTSNSGGVINLPRPFRLFLSTYVTNQVTRDICRNVKLCKGAMLTLWSAPPEDISYYTTALSFSFTNIVNCAVAGNIITCTSSGGWGNSGMSSSYKFYNGDSIECRFLNLLESMIGLSSVDTDQSFASIQYAIYHNNGNIYIFEAGNNILQFATDWAASDILAIKITENKITYYRNGVLVYTSAATPVLPLVLDTSFQQNGSSFSVKYGMEDSLKAYTSAKTTAQSIVSTINQSADSIIIQANKVNLTGLVTIANAAASGQSIFNGDNLTTGSIESANHKTSGGALGLKINLTDGSFDSKYFKLGADGALQLTGGTINIATNASDESIILLTYDDLNYNDPIHETNSISSSGMDLHSTQTDKATGIIYRSGRTFIADNWIRLENTNDPAVVTESNDCASQLTASSLYFYDYLNHDLAHIGNVGPYAIETKGGLQLIGNELNICMGATLKIEDMIILSFNAPLLTSADYIATWALLSAHGSTAFQYGGNSPVGADTIAGMEGFYTLYKYGIRIRLEFHQFNNTAIYTRAMYSYNGTSYVWMGAWAQV